MGRADSTPKIYRRLLLLYLVVFSGVFGVTADELDEAISHSTDYVDDDPEFLVGVKGLDNPLCFNTGGKSGQVARLLQDPQSGIIVNARIFYDSLTNKTYIAAAMIARGSFRLLGKQRVIIVNNTRYEWGDVQILNIDGHRIMIRDNIVAVTFKNLRVTLAIQRHVTTGSDFIDYDSLDREEPRATAAARNESSGSSDKDREAGGAEGGRVVEIMPAVGYEEHESLINHFLSSKGRRSLLLHKMLDISQDRAIVRNLVVELDTEMQRKRRTRQSILEDSADSESQEDSSLHRWSADRTSPPRVIQRQHEEGRDSYTDGKGLASSSPTQQDMPISRGRNRRRRQEVDGDLTDVDVDKRRNKTVFLGFYIADSRDFTNRTHGLLGQFLFKNITQEKLRFSNGRMKARLFVHGTSNRRTIAQLTLRRNLALNATRTCWKIRNQGRDVLDGRYSDYLVPALRYTGLKELPPPAPL